MAYPSFRSSLPTNSYSGSTVTVDTPAGAASGDVLICAFVAAQGSRTLDTLPEGWSIIASDAVERSPGSDSARPSMAAPRCPRGRPVQTCL